MQLSLREKQLFFLQLAQLLRSGQGLDKAAERLTKLQSGRLRQAAKQLHHLLQGQATASEAFARLTPTLDGMERTVLASMTRAGQLEHALERLGNYFEQAEKARREILRGSLYPIFILHFAAVAFHVQLLLQPGGMEQFIIQVLTKIVIIWLIVGALGVLWPMLATVGAVSGVVDRLLRLVPLLGKVRRSFAVSRFCGTLDLQLDAGVNVITAVQAAAQVSRSGLLRATARRAVPALRKGEPLGPLLGRPAGALPPLIADELLLADETGDWHRALPRIAAETEQEAFAALKAATEWIPRLVYLVVAVWVGYKVVTFYQGYFNSIERQIDSVFGG